MGATEPGAGRRVSFDDWVDDPAVRASTRLAPVLRAYDAGPRDGVTAFWAAGLVLVVVWYFNPTFGRRGGADPASVVPPGLDDALAGFRDEPPPGDELPGTTGTTGTTELPGTIGTTEPAVEEERSEPPDRQPGGARPRNERAGDDRRAEKQADEALERAARRAASVAAFEQFVAAEQAKAETRAQRAADRRQRLEGRDDRDERVLWTAGLVTFAFAVLGAVLALFGLVAVGVVSAAVAVLPGAGTAILWRIAQRRRAELAELAAKEERASERAYAMSLTLALPEGERRDQAIYELATDLRRSLTA